MIVRYRAIGSNKEGVITNVYGLNSPHEKDEVLSNISNLGDIVGHERWIIGGDFKIILSLDEKRGHIKRMEKDTEEM